MHGRWFHSWWLALALSGLVASGVAADVHAASAATAPLAQPSIDLQRLAAWLGPRQSLAEEALLADAADGNWDRCNLLEAALAAEGASPRQAAVYALQLNAWARELQHSSGDPAQQAAAALAILHRHALQHYDAQASSLAGVFSENRYNCLGSTIVFCALAQRMGRDCWAIERPGHVLAQMRLEGRVVDVETTSAQGVGMTTSSSADQRVLSPMALVALVYFNRGCDLLQRQEFSAAMSANLAAVRLDPASARARNNLLGAWNNWALALARQGDRPAAARLLRKGLECAPAYPLFSANMHAIGTAAVDGDNR